MAGYCKSCFRDLPSEDAACPNCVDPMASKPQAIVGILLFILVMAGVLTFDSRLTIAAAALAVLAVLVQIVRATARR